MSSAAARDERFRRDYGVSRSAYYVRRKRGMDHEAAIEDARKTARLAPPAGELSRLLSGWRAAKQEERRNEPQRQHSPCR